MTASLIERPMSPGAVWSRRFGGFSFVLLLAVWLCHRYGLVATPDLLPLLSTVLATALAGLAAGLVAHRRYWYFGDRGGPDIFWGLFWSLATIAPFIVVAWWYIAYPKLTDISTDPENPPALVEAARLRTPDMNATVPPTPESIIRQAEAYPLVEGRRYELPIDRVLTAVDDLLQRRGWRVTATRDSVGMAFATTIEALAHSPVWRMPADVAIRLTDEETATFVDMRSASRYGRHDLGDNAARITNFLAELDVLMAAQAVAAPLGAEPAEADEGPIIEIPDQAPPPTQAPAQ
jgi:hypothetical protein